MPLVATLAEFKTHLNRGSDTADDTELTLHLTAASQWVEWRISGPLAVTSFTERLRSNGCTLMQRNHPLATVTSVTPQDGSALPSTSYIVDTTNSFIELRYPNNYGQWWYTVVYTAGLSAIPERVKLAGLEVARHLWTVQNGSSGRGFPSDDLVPTPFGFAVPRRAEELIAADPNVPAGLA